MTDKLVEIEGFRGFSFEEIKTAVDKVFLLMHPLYIRRVDVLDEKIRVGEAPVDYFERLQNIYRESELETAPPQVIFLTIFIAGLPTSGEHSYARKEMITFFDSALDTYSNVML